MDSIQINRGDKFLYVSKYGGVVKGEIAGFHLVTDVDTDKGAMILNYCVKSTNGVYYKLSEIRLCADFLTDEECGGIAAGWAHWTKRKVKMQAMTEKLLNTELNDAVCDATEVDSSTTADNIKN